MPVLVAKLGFGCLQQLIGFVSADALSRVTKSMFATPRVSRAGAGFCASWAIAFPVSALGTILVVGGQGVEGNRHLARGASRGYVFFGVQNLFVGSFLLRAVCLKNLSEAVWAAFRKISELFWLSYVFRSVALQNFVVGCCLVRALCPQNFPKARGARLPPTFWAN